MANYRWFSKVHRAVFKLTDGRIGATLQGMPMVLMHCVGRRSGKIHSIPVNCYHYQQSVCVVASNGGSDQPPLWWLNLQANPNIWIQTGRDKYEVVAEELGPEQRQSIWPDILSINPRQATYERAATRTLPVVYLRRKSETAEQLTGAVR